MSYELNQLLKEVYTYFFAWEVFENHGTRNVNGGFMC